MTRGAVGNINIFKGSLETSKMKAITNGTLCGLPGDYLSWKNMKWNLYGDAKFVNISDEEICKKPRKIFVFNSIYYSAKSCNDQCLRYQRTKIITTKSQEETKNLLDELSDIVTDERGNKHKYAPSTVSWIGITDEEAEGTWTQLNSLEGN